MSIQAELNAINADLRLIRESAERIKSYRQELNKYNPFKVGQELTGNNPYAHNGKPFVVETLRVCESPTPSRFDSMMKSPPKYFLASGPIKLKSGGLGSSTVIRSIPIADVISED